MIPFEKSDKWICFCFFFKFTFRISWFQLLWRYIALALAALKEKNKKTNDESFSVLDNSSVVKVNHRSLFSYFFLNIFFFTSFLSLSSVFSFAYLFFSSDEVNPIAKKKRGRGRESRCARAKLLDWVPASCCASWAAHVLQVAIYATV